jgi:3-phosphoshikimate 1-carboxyvinyltransferase
VFLTASAEKRAERRHKQLISKGEKDYTRRVFASAWRRATQGTCPAAHAPLKPAEDALLLDNSLQTIEESVAQVLTGGKANSH